MTAKSLIMEQKAKLADALALANHSLAGKRLTLFCARSELAPAREDVEQKREAFEKAKDFLKRKEKDFADARTARDSAQEVAEQSEKNLAQYVQDCKKVAEDAPMVQCKTEPVEKHLDIDKDDGSAAGAREQPEARDAAKDKRPVIEIDIDSPEAGPSDTRKRPVMDIEIEGTEAGPSDKRQRLCARHGLSLCRTCGSECDGNSEQKELAVAQAGLFPGAVLTTAWILESGPAAGARPREGSLPSAKELVELAVAYLRPKFLPKAKDRPTDFKDVRELLKISNIPSLVTMMQKRRTDARWPAFKKDLLEAVNKLSKDKKPLTGYFLFMKGFRPLYAEQCAREDKKVNVPEMGSAGGAAWRALSQADRGEYNAGRVPSGARVQPGDPSDLSGKKPEQGDDLTEDDDGTRPEFSKFCFNQDTDEWHPTIIETGETWADKWDGLDLTLLREQSFIMTRMICLEVAAFVKHVKPVVDTWSLWDVSSSFGTGQEYEEHRQKWIDDWLDKFEMLTGKILFNEPDDP